MNKDIKDYLHLYLGCNAKVDTSKPDCLLITGEIIEIDSLCIDYCIHGNLATVLPILRPLSNMTGKEVIELFHLSYNDANYQFEEFQKVDNNEFGWRARNQNGMECFVPANSFKPEVFQWLLSKHFDLFGLIESNLALDKTKI